MPQVLLFELNGARVTPHIATFGGTSYQIANIASVHVARRKKYNPLAVIIFLLGLGILAAAIVKSHMTGLVEEYSSMAATGVAVTVASVLLQLIWPRRVYVLVLRTSSGEVDAVMSRNKEFVFNVHPTRIRIAGEQPAIPVGTAVDLKWSVSRSFPSATKKIIALSANRHTTGTFWGYTRTIAALAPSGVGD
jgi:hypothetical protein